MKIHFAICFVHKMKKFSLFGLTYGRKRSRDSVTGGPIFANLVSKYPQDFKEKSHEAVRLKARRFCVCGKICLRGPPRFPPPPPPVQLGLFFLWWGCGLILSIHLSLDTSTSLMLQTTSSCTHNTDAETRRDFSKLCWGWVLVSNKCITFPATFCRQAQHHNVSNNLLLYATMQKVTGIFHCMQGLLWCVQHLNLTFSAIPSCNWQHYVASNNFLL